MWARAIVAILVSAGVAAVVGVYANCPELFQTRDRLSETHSASPSVRSMSLTAPITYPSLDYNKGQYERTVAQLTRLASMDGREPAEYAHLLRLWSMLSILGTPPQRDTSWPHADRFVARLTDGALCIDSRYPKLMVLEQSSHGPRYALSITDPVTRQLVLPGEAHPGQCLCSLAEAGVPRSHTVRASGKIYTIEDLVDETAWSFNFDEEFEWRTVALLRYRPHVVSWTNKNGTQLTWDSIAQELIMRSSSGEGASRSCYGTHCLFALAMMRHVHNGNRLISASTATAIDAHLSEHAVALQAAQGSRGEWTTAAAASPHAINKAPDLTALLVTGHHLEWLALVPVSVRPRSEVVRRAEGFVLDTLESMSDAQLANALCPATHSIRGVVCLRTQSDDTRADKELPSHNADD
jgi:hypothetical protein